MSLHVHIVPARQGIDTLRNGLLPNPYSESRARPQPQNPPERDVCALRRLRFAMVMTTIVAVAFLLVCLVAMHQVFWMLDQCVPTSKEPEIKAIARRWQGAVAVVVIGAWVCAACIAFSLPLSRVLCVLVFAGPAAITFPVFVWVVLGY